MKEPGIGCDNGNRKKSSMRDGRQCTTPKYYAIHTTVKVHDCLTDSEKNVTRGKLPSFRSSSVPPRPPTRRNPLEMTDLTQKPVRGHSTSPAPVRKRKKNGTKKVRKRSPSLDVENKQPPVVEDRHSNTPVASNEPVVMYENTLAFLNIRPESAISASSSTKSDTSEKADTLISDQQNSANGTAKDSCIFPEQISTSCRSGCNSAFDKKCSCIKEVSESTPIYVHSQSTTRSSQKSSKTVRVPEHEYLQFSLRITEDIIRNDLYSNKEMRRVFNSHIEANRGRLDMDKMKEQIEHLCQELSIPLDENGPSSTPSRLVTKNNDDLVREGCVFADMFSCGKEKKSVCNCCSEHCVFEQCIKNSLKGIVKEAVPIKKDPVCIYFQENCPVAEAALSETEDERVIDVNSLARLTEVTEPSSSTRTTDTKQSDTNTTFSTFSRNEVLSTLEQTDKGTTFTMASTRVRAGVITAKGVQVDLLEPLRQTGEIGDLPSQNETSEEQGGNITGQIPSVSFPFEADKQNSKEEKQVSSGHADADTEREIKAIYPAQPHEFRKTFSEFQSVRILNSQTPQTSTPRVDNEYILIPGPIYVPKSSITFGSDLEKSSSYVQPTTVYSELHNKADNIKHYTSTHSSYHKEVDNMPVDELEKIESRLFREPPKIFGYCRSFTDGEPAQIFSRRCPHDCNTSDYDETPQKDNVVHCGGLSKKPDESTPTSQQVDIVNQADVSSGQETDLIDNLMKNEVNPSFQACEETMTDAATLLLGDEYKLGPSEVLESALPYPISLFFPSMATQTSSQDFLGSVTPASSNKSKMEAEIIQSKPPIARPRRSISEASEGKHTVRSRRLSAKETVAGESSSSIATSVFQLPKELTIPKEAVVEEPTTHSIGQQSPEVSVKGSLTEPLGKVEEHVPEVKNEKKVVRPLEMKNEKEVSKDSSSQMDSMIQETEEKDVLALLDDEPMELSMSASQEIEVEKAVADVDRFRQADIGIAASARKSSLKILASYIEENPPPKVVVEEQEEPPKTTRRVSLPNYIYQEEEMKQVQDDKALEDERDFIIRSQKALPRVAANIPEDGSSSICCSLKKFRKKKEKKNENTEHAATNDIIRNKLMNMETLDSTRKSIRFETKSDLLQDHIVDEYDSPFVQTMGSLTSDLTLQAFPIPIPTQPVLDDIPSTLHSHYAMPDEHEHLQKMAKKPVQVQKESLNEMQMLKKSIMENKHMEQEDLLSLTVSKGSVKRPSDF